MRNSRWIWFAFLLSFSSLGQMIPSQEQDQTQDNQTPPPSLLAADEEPTTENQPLEDEAQNDVTPPAESLPAQQEALEDPAAHLPPLENLSLLQPLDATFSFSSSALLVEDEKNMLLEEIYYDLLEIESEITQDNGLQQLAVLQDNEQPNQPTIVALEQSRPQLTKKLKENLVQAKKHKIFPRLLLKLAHPAKTILLQLIANYLHLDLEQWLPEDQQHLLDAMDSLQLSSQEQANIMTTLGDNGIYMNSNDEEEDDDDDVVQNDPPPVQEIINDLNRQMQGLTSSVQPSNALAHQIGQRNLTDDNEDDEKKANENNCLKDIFHNLFGPPNK